MSEHGRHLADGEREFFEKFFQRLKAKSITAILLRNYDLFPAEIGHDLDVFFRRADLAGAVNVFAGLLKEIGGQVLHVQELDYVLAVWFRTAGPAASPIHLDFFHGAFTWHNLRYLTDEELISQCRPSREFKVPRPAHEALNLFLTSLLWGSFFKLRYRDRLRELLSAPDEAAEFWRLLEREFGTNSRPPFDICGEDAPSKQQQRDYAAKLRRALKVRAFLRNPFTALFRLARHWRQELATVISPPGIHIAVLGPDGSGKSTVIEALKERLDDYFGEKVEGHWRPSVLPDIGVVSGQRKQSAGPTKDPHRQRPHPVLISTLRFFYYWLDYWLGWPFRIRKPKAGNCLVLYDRYALDMWCDPRRYRLRLPGWILKSFCRFVPTPDFIFILVGDADSIHKRKGEVPIEMLRELLQRYTDAAKSFPHARPVDCNRPVEAIADELSGLVLNRLHIAAGRNHWFRRNNTP